MKKSTIALSVIVILAGGAYGVNNYLVNKVASMLPEQVTAVLSSVDSEYASVQQLSSHVIGDHVEQEYAVYLIDNGKRLDSPLHIKHTADVQPFGLKVVGKIEIPKDKGLSKEIIDNVATFNEKIDYIFSTTNEEVDLKGELKVGRISSGRKEQIVPGLFSFNFNGNKEHSTSSYIMDSFTIKTGDDKIEMGKADLRVSNTEQEQSINLAIDELKYSNNNKYHTEEAGLSGVMLKSTFSNDEITIMSNDWRISNVYLNNKEAQIPNVSIGFSSIIDGINVAKMEELAEEPIDEIPASIYMSEMFGDGIKVSSLDFNVNESSIKGYFNLASADYSNLKLYEIENKLGKSVDSKLDITLDKALLTNLNLPVGKIGQYLDEESDAYTGTLSIANGMLSINGIALR